MRSLLTCSLVVAAIASVCSASAQGAPPVVGLKISTPTVVAGKTFDAVVTITFAEGLHGYQNPPSDPTLIPVKVTAGDKVFKVLKVKYPVGTPTKVDGEEKLINLYQGTVKIPVTLQAPAKVGKVSLSLAVGYQECNDRSCFPPSSLTATATVTVVKKAVVAKTKVASLGND